MQPCGGYEIDGGKNFRFTFGYDLQLWKFGAQLGIGSYHCFRLVSNLRLYLGPIQLGVDWYWWKPASTMVYDDTEE